jgi:hypothetical protein
MSILGLLRRQIQPWLKGSFQYPSLTPPSVAIGLGEEVVNQNFWPRRAQA